MYFATTLYLSFPVMAEQPFKGYLTPDICSDRVYFTVNPLLPKHSTGEGVSCRISVSFTVLSNGKVGHPLSEHEIKLDDLGDLVSATPASCRESHGPFVVKALRKAQFSAAEESYECTYSYSWDWK